MLELVLKRGGVDFLRRPVGQSEITVGRSPTNSIQITEPEISRIHCKIEPRGEKAVLIDLSTNGTFVNGCLAKESVLNIGDNIVLGSWEMAIERGGDAISIDTIARDPQGTCIIKFDPTTKMLKSQAIDFRILSPDSAPFAHSVCGETVTLGHHASNTLSVPDPFVSRRHCSLSCHDGKITLTDLGSTNGTFVNDMRIKQCELPSEGTFRIGRSTVQYNLSMRNEGIKPSKSMRMGKLIGKTQAMREIFTIIERIAPTDCTVCITGDSGSGKELVAHELHERSRRVHGPFVAINCGAIPASIIEGQLFGHEKGAFTGATERSAGLLEQADGGTLFLDEIGEMPLELQPRLLRALEDHKVRRIGGSSEIRFDARIICATNRDLIHMAQTGRFREDLLYRIFIVPIELPPLAGRREDIRAIADEIIAEATPSGRKVQLTNGAWEKLLNHSWPGNVRELKNTIQRSIILSQGDMLDEGAIKIMGPRAVKILNDEERTAVQRALELNNWNLSATCKALGIARTTLQIKIKKYSIPIPSTDERRA